MAKLQAFGAMKGVVSKHLWQPCVERMGQTSMTAVVGMRASKSFHGLANSQGLVHRGHAATSWS